MPKPRESVDWFASEHMERRLAEHDRYKRGWKSLPPTVLMDKLGHTYKKLGAAVDELRGVRVAQDAEGRSTDPDPSEATQYILDKAADIANYSMMIADNARDAFLFTLRGVLEGEEEQHEQDS